MVLNRSILAHFIFFSSYKHFYISYLHQIKLQSLPITCNFYYNLNLYNTCKHIISYRYWLIYTILPAFIDNELHFFGRTILIFYILLLCRTILNKLHKLYTIANISQLKKCYLKKTSFYQNNTHTSSELMPQTLKSYFTIVNAIYFQIFCTKEYG